MSHQMNKQDASAVLAQIPGYGITLAAGTTPPADGAVGYAPNCLFLDIDATGGAGFYVNRGTKASANFDATIDLAALTATLAEINAVVAGNTATAAEITRAADVSTRLVTLAVSTAITEALHEGRTILMTGAGAARTFTLPAATGSGAKYRFVVGEVNTSNYIINSVVGTDLMRGVILGDDGGGLTTALVWAAGATDDSVLLNGTTTGGVSIGDWVEFEDITATAWAVRGVVQQSGAEATPFRDAVA